MLKTIVKFSHQLSLIVGMALIVGLATPTAAKADDEAEIARIREDLKSKVTRSPSASPVEEVKQRAIEAEEDQRLEQLKKLAKDRGLSVSERSEMAVITEKRPQHNFDIQFEFNSAVIGKAGQEQLNNLGRALQGGEGADTLLAGHTDAKGKAAYNQRLSQARAEAVRDYLVKNFNVPSEKLTAVGYGREKPIDPRHPYAEENRRVQVINVSTKTASR